MSASAEKSSNEAVAEPRENPTTLYAALLPQCMKLADIKKKYPFVTTLKEVLGAVPNLLPISLLFRGSFEFQSIAVPAFFNLPMPMFGIGPDLTSLSLATFAASESASCMYCVLHSCVSLKRFGAADGLVAGKSRTVAQEASVALGAALGALPPIGVESAVRGLGAHFSKEDVERHALAVGGMGYLNTVNDLLGTDLEEGVMLEGVPLLEGTGWTAGHHAIGKPKGELQEVQRDFRNGLGWGTKLRMLWHMPSALLHKFSHTWGLPGEHNEVREYLTMALGEYLSVTDDISDWKVRQAVVMLLRDHLVAEDCMFPKILKYAVGKAFSAYVGNEILEREMGDLFKHEDDEESSSESVNTRDGLPQFLQTVVTEAARSTDWTATVVGALSRGERVREQEAPPILLCLNAFAQPLKPSEDTVRIVTEAVPAKVIVEIVSWMGVLVMLNRLMAYYRCA